MFVDYEYKPVIEDFHGDSSLKIETVLKIFENAGNTHSDLIGNNVLEGCSNGITWIFTDWFVKMEKFPRYGQKILAKTWINSSFSLFGCDRNFELYADGEFCGFAIAKFVLFDIANNKPAKIDSSLVDMYKPEEKTVYAEKRLPRILVPSEFDASVEIKPRRNDIDFNNHVHNLVYMDYAMEALPLELYKKHSIKNVRITYKAPVTEGENILVKHALVESSHVFCIYADDGSLKTTLQFEE